jgi:hypothetical protein
MFVLVFLYIPSMLFSLAREIINMSVELHM